MRTYHGKNKNQIFKKLNKMTDQKQPLSVEQVVGKMSYQQLLNYYRPDWNNEQVKEYLWNHTCYPFSTEVLIAQLNRQLLTNEAETD